jgi:hypothetical protein
MINKETAASAIALSLSMAGQGKVISAVAGTPLADLVGLTIDANRFLTVDVSEDATSESVNDFLMSNAGLLETTTSGVGSALSNHDIALDNYIASISAAVRNHISFAKNTVAPAVLTMANDVIKMMGTKKSTAADFSIEVKYLPSPMVNGGFEDSVAGYAGKVRFPPENKLRLGAMSFEQLVELIQTGSAAYDKTVAEWLSTKPATFWTNLWCNVFMGQSCALESENFDIVDLFKSSKTGVDEALFVYLVARKLHNSPPEKTEMSLSRFKEVITQHLVYTADKLVGALKADSDNFKTGTLVSDLNRNKKCIVVNGNVYRGWIELGGTNEVLLGLLVTNDNFFSVAKIDEGRQNYLDSWNTYEHMSDLAEKNKSFTNFKQYLTIAFADSMKNVTQSEKDMVAAMPNVSENIINYFSDGMRMLSIKDMSDVHEVCLKLMTRSRFYYTDAEKLLRGINEAVRINPNIDVRQAALMSMIEYVTDYVVDQMKITAA